MKTVNSKVNLLRIPEIEDQESEQHSMFEVKEDQSRPQEDNQWLFGRQHKR